MVQRKISGTSTDALNTCLFVRVTDKTRSRFRQVARNANKTESELLREMIALVVDKHLPQEERPVGINPGNARTSQLTLRLPAFLMEAVKERAKKDGMAASRWVMALVQSTLLKIPVMTGEELRVLGRCSSELSAIGRNLNQVARILNADSRETEKLKLELLEAVLVLVSEMQQAIRTLVRASNQRWDSL